jgi:alpha-mannosidase
MRTQRTSRLAGGLALALATAGVAPAVAQTQSRIYIAPDDHTDYMWSADEATYARVLPETLDAYLQQIDDTAASPSDQQARWNTDGSLWMSEFERQRTPAQMTRLMDRVRDGHISMPLNTIVSVHGATPLEGILRDMYYAGRLERRFNVRFPVAVAMENQTAAYGLGSVFAGAGARYTWKGVCACATNVPAAGDRERDAYWWTGPDGSRLLTKWMSLHDRLPSASDRNQGPGGYAEARYPREVIPFVSTSSAFQARWSYNVIGLFGQGWDDVETITPLTDPNSFPAVARDLSTPGRRVIVSNQLDFFGDFNATAGASLPSQGVSFGNEWEISLASFAEKSARVRRAIERLRGAEALTTIVALEDATFLNGRQTARDAAFRGMGLFFEHNIGGNGPALTNEARADFQERQAAAIETYVDKLRTDAVTKFGSYLPSASTGKRFFVFNQLGFARTDIAEFGFPGTAAFRVIDTRTDTEIPAQPLGSGNGRRVRLLATNVPATGYVIYEVRAGTPTAYPKAATYSGGILTSATHKLRVTTGGAISSLVEIGRGNKEWVNAATGRRINDFGSGTGSLAVESSGPVSLTLRATIGGVLPRQVRVTVYAGLPRIDIENVIKTGFDDVRTYGFGFSLTDPLVRHEEVGAVIKARLAPDGDYSPRAINSIYEWLTLGHFADMTDGSGSAGITLSNNDAYFMRIGNSTRAQLDTATPSIDVLAGGRAYGDALSGIRFQGYDSKFTHRFSLLTHGAYQQKEAMQFALAAQNPFVVGTVTGPASGARINATSWALATWGDSPALLWALKPAEEGIASGVIARYWNQDGSPATAPVNFNARYAVSGHNRTSHVETDLAADDPLASPDPDQLRGNQIVTVRYRVARP